MRFLSALLLIAVPLLAQEPTDEERQAEEARRAAEERQRADQERQAAAEKAAYDKRAEELRLEAEQRSKWGITAEELKRRLLDLQSADEATRADAMEQLKRVDAKLEDLLPVIEDLLARTERVRGTLNDLRVKVEPRTIYLAGLAGGGGSEAISGTVDGTEYSLKSLGGGKYQLAATKRDGDGRVMEQIEDQGTMVELQGKYPFLAAGLAVQWKAPAAANWAKVVELQTAAPAGVRAWRAPLAVGTDVQYGAWDGGGRVGVTVCAPSEDLRFHLQLPEGAGFIVQHVVPGSRAEQIGIRRMDILLKLDGELIDSPIQLKKLHEKAGVLEILRRSESRKIDLATIPDEKPADRVLEDKFPAETETAPAGAR